MKPGDLVDFSCPRYRLRGDHAELKDMCGILLEHSRSRRWKGGIWQILWDGRVIVAMGMDLKRVVDELGGEK